MNVKKYFYLSFHLFLINWLMLGCSTETVTPFPGITTTIVASEPVPTRTLLPQKSSAVLPSDTPRAVDTDVAQLQIEKEPKPLFSICSPLAMESIPELFEIVSDPYKPPPPNRKEERHHGVDFSHYTRKDLQTIELEGINSIMDGRVAAVIEDKLPYGNMVIVETTFDLFPPEIAEKIPLPQGSSLYVLYAHMNQKPAVRLNEDVVCGQKLGEVGKSGYNIVNPHLHLEIRIGPPEISFDEMEFYTTAASLIGMENYTRWRTGGEFNHIDPMKVFDIYLGWINAQPE